ncbi:hypothetical protein Tco_0224199, partial [Tanacetum coccineum]
LQRSIQQGTHKSKLATRKKMKSRKRRYIQNTSEDDSDKENDELRLHLTIAPDEEKRVDYDILDRVFLRIKRTQPSESESQSSEFDTCESNISAEPSELMSERVVNESNVECQPKVWSDAPIIEEYESNSEDKCVSKQEKPSFAN